jgi:uncharacterized protein (DUF342 family)
MVSPDYKHRAAEGGTTATGSQIDGDEEIEEAMEVDMDGEFFVQIRQGVVYGKATAAIGEGEMPTLGEVKAVVRAKGVEDYDEDRLEEILDEAEGEYEPFGKVKANPAGDTMVYVENENDMRAYITVQAPKPGGSDWTYEQYDKFLKSNFIIFGINEEVLRNFADRPIYGQKVLVAEGKPAINGLSSYMEYYFEADPGIRLRESEGGRVDFKELNLIQNVLKDQALAKKIPAEKGVEGESITGERLHADDGHDVPITLGSNVHWDNDGLTVLADLNGQVLLIAGKINVEPVYTVDGSVNLKTGNIVFLGTVVVTGNVEEGFSVKASGNIEVKGTVDKADMEADGDIVVRQGITGKLGCQVKAGKSVWAKFIENANVTSGDMVVVSDGILNSQIAAQKRILCNGKRAVIIGGRLQASEEILAKQLGSNSSGSETVCEVGFDPQNKQKLDALNTNLQKAQGELDELQLNIQTLNTLKEQRKGLPEDKEEYLQELTAKRDDLVNQIDAMNAEINAIKKYLSSLQNVGRISASAKVNVGTVICIRDIREQIQSEYKAVTFVAENSMIRAVPYSESKEAKDASASSA